MVVAEHLLIVFAIALCFTVLERQGWRALWWLAPAAWATVGLLQYRLVQAMHEACHQLHRWPDAWRPVMKVLLFRSLGLSPRYISAHLAHHRHIGDRAKDPDGPAYFGFPRSRLDFLGQIVLHFSGFSAVRQFFVGGTLQDNGGSSLKSTSSEKAQVIATQVVWAAALGLLIHPAAYLFYVIPLVSFVKAMGWVRVLAEHGHPEKDYVLRTFPDGFIARHVSGPYGLNYHAEHHLRMAIPYERLTGLHRELQEDPSARVEIETYRGNHFSLLWFWLRELPWRGSAHA